MQSTVDSDDLARRLAEAIRDKQEICFRLIGWCDRGLGQRSLRIKVRKYVGERIIGLTRFMADRVFRK